MICKNDDAWIHGSATWQSIKKGKQDMHKVTMAWAWAWCNAIKEKDMTRQTFIELPQQTKLTGKWFEAYLAWSVSFQKALLYSFRKAKQQYKAR